MLDLQVINDKGGRWTFTYIMIDNKPWFRGRDIAKYLDYKDTDYAIRQHVDIDYKKKLSELRPGEISALDYNERISIYIDQYGLIDLTLSSKKPEAIIFKKWIIKDVIPSILTTGRYEVDQQEAILLAPQYILKQLNLFNESMINQNRLINLNTENDLHYAVVQYLRRFFPHAKLKASLGELQVCAVNGDVVSDRRLEAWKKGHNKGENDLTIINTHISCTGLAIEFKHPRGVGDLKPDQDKYLYEMQKLGFDILVSNDYDVIINRINKHFEGVRVICDYCKSLFKTDQSLKNHVNGFHYNIKPNCGGLSV